MTAFIRLSSVQFNTWKNCRDLIIRCGEERKSAFILKDSLPHITVILPSRISNTQLVKVVLMGGEEHFTKCSMKL